MRIVVACELWYPDTFGGSERHAAETVRNLALRGHDVAVWTLRNGRADLAEREETADGVTVNRRGAVASYRWLPRTIPMLGVGLAGAREARRADLVITHHLWPSLTIATPGGPPILHQFHASPTAEWEYNAGSTSRHLEGGPLSRLRPVALRGYGAAMWRAERRVIRQAAAVTALSEFSRGVIAERHPDALERLTLVPGGVDTDRFRPAGDRDALRGRLGWHPDERVLLTVRRLAPRMGVSVLLNALARLAPEHPRLRLMVVGDGFLRPGLEAESAALGLTGRAEFRGRVDDPTLEDLYRAADLFVLPTQAYEGFGMVTLESLASGTPVVATPAGASPEILRPLDPALVADDIGEEALARAIGTALARDPAAMRAAARAHAETYAWPVVMDAYEDLCLRVAR